MHENGFFVSHVAPTEVAPTVRLYWQPHHCRWPHHRYSARASLGFVQIFFSDASSSFLAWSKLSHLFFSVGHQGRLGSRLPDLARCRSTFTLKKIFSWRLGNMRFNSISSYARLPVFVSTMPSPLLRNLALAICVNIFLICPPHPTDFAFCLVHSGIVHFPFSMRVGGFGVVFLADDVQTQQQYALKVAEIHL